MHSEELLEALRLWLSECIQDVDMEIMGATWLLKSLGRPRRWAVDVMSAFRPPTMRLRGYRHSQCSEWLELMRFNRRL